MGNSLSADRDAWLKVADTALPRNIIGYLIQICLSPLNANPFTLLPYNDPKEVAKCERGIGTKSFLLGKLPEREGPRPEISKFLNCPQMTCTKCVLDILCSIPLSDSA
jgi:hypothetical protein